MALMPMKNSIAIVSSLELSAFLILNIILHFYSGELVFDHVYTWRSGSQLANNSWTPMAKALARLSHQSDSLIYDDLFSLNT